MGRTEILQRLRPERISQGLDAQRYRQKLFRGAARDADAPVSQLQERIPGWRAKARFIYVRDCVDVILWLLDNPGVSGLYNLGSGQARTWMDLASALFAALGRSANVEIIEMPFELQSKYQYFTQARMDRLRSAGYTHPFTSLEDGVRDYVHHYLMQGDSYR